MHITAYLIGGKTSAWASVARTIFERNKSFHIREKEIGYYGNEPVTEMVYDCPAANVPLIKHELETKARCVMERPIMSEREPDVGVQALPAQTVDRA